MTRKIVQLSSRRWPGALAVTAIAAALSGAVAPAHAVDGCLVLLCLAAPSWRNVPECVSPVRQVLRDLSLGRPFPVCDMSGDGNGASNQMSSAASCPPQYVHNYGTESGGDDYRCDYAGAVSVTIDGQPWSRVWWSFEGDTVTEFSPAAKAQFGSWDTRFDDDYAAWLTSHPALPPCSGCD